ncbi:hypothetical protein NGUA11_01966 [Salmonella enterica]|nr:hypothetical protein NGUA11_01966 [Salmonella enterica]
MRRWQGGCVLVSRRSWVIVAQAIVYGSPTLMTQLWSQYVGNLGESGLTETYLYSAVMTKKACLFE